MAKTTITGFDTTQTTKAAGTVVTDTVTVTPGAGRQVLVQHKKSGADSWTTAQTLTASPTGEVTVSLKAFAGTTAWRVRAVKSVDHGAVATTVSRTLVGQ